MQNNIISEELQKEINDHLRQQESKLIESLSNVRPLHDELIISLSPKNGVTVSPDSNYSISTIGDNILLTPSENQSDRKVRTSGQNYKYISLPKTITKRLNLYSMLQTKSGLIILLKATISIDKFKPIEFKINPEEQ